MFNIGDTVYTVSFETRDILMPCPVCFGNKEIMITLGNGDQWMVACDFCRQGFSDPLGKIVDSCADTVRVVPGTITGVDARTNEDGLEITYWLRGGYGLGPERVAATFEEAAALGEALLESRYQMKQKDLETKVKYNINKSYSWNMGYYQKQIKEAERTIAFAQSKIRQIQPLVRKERKKE